MWHLPDVANTRLDVCCSVFLFVNTFMLLSYSLYAVFMCIIIIIIIIVIMMMTITTTIIIIIIIIVLVVIVKQPFRGHMPLSVVHRS